MRIFFLDGWSAAAVFLFYDLFTSLSECLFPDKYVAKLSVIVTSQILTFFSDSTFYIRIPHNPPTKSMGRNEKILIVGFVAITASASAFAHYYTMQEGYAMKARKENEASKEKNKNNSNNSNISNSNSKKDQRKAPTVGGVWGNIGKQRDALAAASNNNNHKILPKN
jgi:hypothetical protein